MLMSNLIGYSKWLGITEILLIAGLLVVMARRGLARTYGAFFTFILLDAGATLVFLSLPFGTNRYANWYLISTPVFWVLSFFVINEIYANILADFPGIVSCGKWVIGGAFVLAVAVSLATAGYDWNISAHRSSATIFQYTFIERGITTAQVVFLLAMTAFLRWFPAPLKRNVHVHTVILFLYFLIRSASLVLRNLVAGPESTMIVNLVNMVAYCMCLVAWMWQFSPERIDRPVRYRKVDESEEQRILGALRDLNNTILGAGKWRSNT